MRQCAITSAGCSAQASREEGLQVAPFLFTVRQSPPFPTGRHLSNQRHWSPMAIWAWQHMSLSLHQSASEDAGARSGRLLLISARFCIGFAATQSICEVHQTLSCSPSSTSSPRCRPDGCFPEHSPCTQLPKTWFPLLWSWSMWEASRASHVLRLRTHTSLSLSMRGS